MVQQLQPGGSYSLACSGGGTQPVFQAVYDLYSCFAGNETSALNVLDQYGIADANLSTSYFPNGGPFSYFQNQYSSLYAWRTMTNASYHGLQVTLKTGVPLTGSSSISLTPIGVDRHCFRC